MESSWLSRDSVHPELLFRAKEFPVPRADASSTGYYMSRVQRLKIHHLPCRFCQTRILALVMSATKSLRKLFKCPTNGIFNLNSLLVLLVIPFVARLQMLIDFCHFKSLLGFTFPAILNQISHSIVKNHQ